MDRTEHRPGAVTEDRKAPYEFATKLAADAVGCHPRKFCDWWLRTRRKLIELHRVQPGETAIEFMRILSESRD